MFRRESLLRPSLDYVLKTLHMPAGQFQPKDIKNYEIKEVYHDGILLREVFPLLTLFLSNCLCFFQKRSLSSLWGWPSHLVLLNSRIFLQTSATKMTKKWSSLLKFASKVPFVVFENRPFRQRWPHWPDLNLIWWQTNLYQQGHLRHRHLHSPGQIQTRGTFRWTGHWCGILFFASVTKGSK